MGPHPVARLNEVFAEVKIWRRVEKLQSLLEQRGTASVLLVLPRGKWRRGGSYPTSIPPWLSRMTQRSKRLRIVRSRDFGPGTALLKAKQAR